MTPIDLDALPPCLCGGQLAHYDGGSGAPQRLMCPSCGWEYECGGEVPTIRSAPWTAALVAEIERLRAEHCTSIEPCASCSREMARLAAALDEIEMLRSQLRRCP